MPPIEFSIQEFEPLIQVGDIDKKTDRFFLVVGKPNDLFVHYRLHSFKESYSDFLSHFFEPTMAGPGFVVYISKVLGEFFELVFVDMDRAVGRIFFDMRMSVEQLLIDLFGRIQAKTDLFKERSKPVLFE